MTRTEPKRPRVPRGLARDGAALWSYGFRPFFLGAGVWAVAAMALWIAALAHGLPLGGAYGAPSGTRMRWSSALPRRCWRASF